MSNYWKKVWKNIEFAVRARDNFSMKTKIGVQSLLLPDNIHSLGELAKRCREIGVDYLVIKPYSHHLASKTKDYQYLKYVSYMKELDRIKEYKTDEFDVIIRHNAFQDIKGQCKSYSTCFSVPYFWAYVNSEGNVYGCSSFLGDERFCYGNIGSEQFSEIWMGENRQEAMKFMKTLDVGACRKGCRMNEVNKYLWDIVHPGEHKNFI